MKSKNTKIQKFKKGMAVFLSLMFVVTPMVTPIAYATQNEDEDYKNVSFLEVLSEGTIGSTVSDFVEYFKGQDTIYINNETQLRALAELVNSGTDCSGKEIYLTNNIVIDDELEWTPIGNIEHKFNGTFNGKDNKIIGLEYSKEGKIYEELSNIGLFGVIGKDAKVSNVITEDFSIDIFYDTSDIRANSGTTKGVADTFYQNAGNIAGINYGTIENCKNISDIRGGSNVGGIVGTNEGTIENCTNNASVIGYDNVGGIAGTNKGTVKECINMSDVKGAEQDIGGIAGLLNGGTVILSQNTGNVQGNTQTGEICVGGIVGGNYNNGSIKYSMNEGKITYNGTAKKIYGILGNMNADDNAMKKTVIGCISKAVVGDSGDLNQVAYLCEIGVLDWSLLDEDEKAWGFVVEDPLPYANYDNGYGIFEVGQSGKIQDIKYNVEGKEYSVFIVGGNKEEETAGNVIFNPIVKGNNSLDDEGGFDLGYEENEGDNDEKITSDYEIFLDENRELLTQMSINLFNGDTKLSDNSYLKVGDKLKVKTEYNKKIYTELGTNNTAITKDTAPKLSVVIGENDEEKTINLSVVEDTIKIDTDKNTTYVEYELEITQDIVTAKEGTLIKKLLIVGGPYYAVSGERENDSSKWDELYKIDEINKELLMNAIIDTVSPTIITKVYGENKEINRYTEGEKIFVELTTSEAIVSPCDEVPQIKLTFTNGKEKILNSENATRNEDRTTTWIYSYEIKDGDEGQLRIQYTAGKIKDLAGNETNLVALYTVNEDVFSESDSNWNENLNVDYELYENDDQINKITYFTEGKNLKVVITFDQLLYSYDDTIISGGEEDTKTDPIDTNRAPSLYLPKGVKATVSEVAFDKTNENTTITYIFENIAKEYTELTSIKNLKLINENNKKVVLTNGNVSDVETAQAIRLRKGDTKELLSANASKILNVENIIIDPKNIISESEKFEIYADTTAPTVEITTEPKGPTNADEIRYIFKWSEEVIGFDESDITVNFGEKVTIKEGEGEEAPTRVAFEKVADAENTYTLLVKPSTTLGNEGELQVIIPEAACKDLVNKGNIAQESNIAIDKVQPNFVSWNIKEDTVTKNVIVEAIFNEAILEAPELQLTIGGIASKGAITEDIFENKVIYTYTPSAADGGKVEATLSGTAIDIAGNSSNEINEVLGSDFELERTEIRPNKDVNVWYTFKKDNSSINDFSIPTYFVAGNKITVTKHEEVDATDENGEKILDEDGNVTKSINETTYSYTLTSDIKFNNLKINYMLLIAPVEGEENGTASFAKTIEELVKTVGNAEIVNISEANIYFDTVTPKLTLSAEIEEQNENSIYSEGQEIIIYAETSEAIKNKDEVPQINVSFSESGIGKYNYQGTNATTGNAQYLETIENEDGTTTWKYKYITQNGDEGELSLGYAKESTLVDLAGNRTKLEADPKPTIGEVTLSEIGIPLSDIKVDGTEATVSYEIYKNNTKIEDFTNNTYFKNSDTIKVIANFSAPLYSSYGSDDTLMKKETAPKLTIDGKEFEIYEVSSDGKTVKYSYTVNGDANEKLESLELTFGTKLYVNKGDATITSGTAILTDITNCNLHIYNSSTIYGNIDINIDTTLPTVEITADKENPTNADEITYTFEFSEKVEGFDVEDIKVNGGNKVVNEDGKFAFEVVNEGVKYTLKIKPLVGIGEENEVKVTVEKDACKDLVGLGNIRSESIIRVDRKAPTVEIKANKEKVNGTEAITYEFIWSEPVTGFDVEDVTVNNGNKGTLTGEGNYYTLEVVPTGENDVEVSIATGVATDAAGNDNIASSKHVIAVLPTVVITTNVENPTKEEKVAYTFTWSEDVTGFTVEDIIVPETAVKGELTANGNKYTMVVNYDSIIPNGNQGEVTIAVVENAVEDSNGNKNAYVSNTLKIDRISPIIVSLEAFADVSIEVSERVDTTKEYYKAGDIVKIVATFSENIENSTAPAMALKFSESGNAKGTVSAGIISGNKITYTYTITEGDLGELSVKKFSGKVIDAAGNETIVSNKTLEGDTIIADTIAPKLVGITAIAPNFEYDELLKDGETKRYGVESKTRENNTITIIAEYSENVYNLKSNKIDVLTSTVAPKLKLKFGTGAARTAIFDKVEGSKVYYTYDIAKGDNKELSIVSLTGNVSDIAGNTLEVNANSPVFGKYEESITEENKVEKIIADTTKSNITYTTSAINYDDDKNIITGNGTQYRRGAVITVTATTDEYVYKNTDKSLERFTTAPELSISFATSGVGKGAVTAANVEYKDNKTVFTYTYEIKDNDNGQLTLNIDELVGYDIALNGNNAKEENKNIYADTVNPVTNWQSWVESEGYGIVDNLNGTWEVTFSEKLYVYDNMKYKVGSELSNSNKDKAPILLVSNDNVTALETTITNITTNDDGKTVITYSYTPYAKNIGAYGMKFASVSDKAGNLFNLKDQVAPRLENIKVTSPEAGRYKAGEVVTIVATFSEKITGTAPTLALQFADSGDAKGTVSAGIIEENTITYTYTIVDGDNGVLQVKSFTSTGLFDLSDNKWVVPETVTLSGNRIVVDTTKPVINKVEVKDNNTVIGSYVRQPEAYNPGKTNANEIEYVITFSENINLVNQDLIELTNGVISKVVCQGNKLTVTAKITTEGVQSLSILEGAVVDLAKIGGNTNEFFRFNGLTVDFTKPTVRFVSEYNGGLYVLPTSIGKVEIRTNVEINEEISKIEYKWDSGNYDEITEYSSASDIVVPTKEFDTAGKHTLYIKVTDIAGNITEASKEYKVVASKVKIISRPSNEVLTNEDVIVTVEFEEGLTDNRRVEFKAEGSDNYKGIAPNSDGTYTVTENGMVYAEATDKVGNKVFSETPIENIDKVDPVIEIALEGADLVIGTGEDNATIKTDVRVTDNRKLEYAKFAFLQDDINEYNMSAEDKAKIINNLNNEAKIENAESTKDKTPYYLYVIAKDKAGNEIIEKAGPFNVLDTNERLLTSGPNVEGSSIKPAEIDIKELIDFEQEGKQVYISYNDSIIKEKVVTLTNSQDGNYNEEEECVYVNKETTITVVGKDACGNTVTNTFPVTRESIQGPEFEVYGIPFRWTNENIILEVYAKEELSALTVNGKNILSEDKFSGTDVITENGEYKIVATDMYGLTSEQVIEIIDIDKDAPTISDAKISKVGDSEKAITITAEDSLSGIAEYAITDTTEFPIEWSKSKEIKVTHDGNFYIWAKDNAGNIARYEKVVILDTTAPTIRFDNTLTTVEAGMPIEVNVVTDEKATISYSWDEEEWEGSNEYVTSVRVNKEYNITGKYTLYVKATDEAGNESKAQIEITVTNPETVLDPQVVFEGLYTTQIDGIHYVKVSPNMTTEDVTNKMKQSELCGLTPEYTKLAEENKLKTGSEITLNGDTKYIVVVKGDVNSDGKAGDFIADIIGLNRYRIKKTGLTTAQILAGDINDDGVIDFIDDIMKINRYRIGIISNL